MFIAIRLNANFTSEFWYAHFLKHCASLYKNQYGHLVPLKALFRVTTPVSSALFLIEWELWQQLFKFMLANLPQRSLPQSIGFTRFYMHTLPVVICFSCTQHIFSLLAFICRTNNNNNCQLLACHSRCCNLQSQPLAFISFGGVNVSLLTARSIKRCHSVGMQSSWGNDLLAAKCQCQQMFPIHNS